MRARSGCELPAAVDFVAGAGAASPRPHEASMNEAANAAAIRIEMAWSICG